MEGSTLESFEIHPPGLSCSKDAQMGNYLGVSSGCMVAHADRTHRCVLHWTQTRGFCHGTQWASMQMHSVGLPYPKKPGWPCTMPSTQAVYLPTVQAQRNSPDHRSLTSHSERERRMCWRCVEDLFRDMMHCSRSWTDPPHSGNICLIPSVSCQYYSLVAVPKFYIIIKFCTKCLWGCHWGLVSLMATADLECPWYWPLG